MAVEAPEKSTRADNASWHLQYMGFPLVSGGLWEHGLDSTSELLPTSLASHSLQRGVLLKSVLSILPS